MTDEVKLESGPEEPEVQEQPTPEVPSVPSAVEQPSAPSLDADSLAAKVAEMVRKDLQQDIERQFQSTKDRRYASVEKIAAYLDAAGGDVEKATRELKVDEILAREGVSQSEVLGRTEDETAAAFTAISEEILSGAGIAFDDPEYLAFVAKHNNKITTPESWRSVLQAHADRRRVQSQRQEGVTPAATPSSGGTVVQPTDEQESLTQELADMYAGKKGSLGKPENRKRIREIKDLLDTMSPPVEVSE